MSNHTFHIILIIVLALLFAFLSGMAFEARRRNKTNKKRKQQSQLQTKVLPETKPMPDLIKAGVLKWASKGENDIPDDAIKFIGYATAENCAAHWLEGRWYCDINMELSDWNCLQELLIDFDEIEPVEAMYTDAGRGVIQLYFRAVSKAEMLEYFVDSAPM